MKHHFGLVIILRDHAGGVDESRSRERLQYLSFGTYNRILYCNLELWVN